MNKKKVVGFLVGMGMLGCALSASASDNLFKSYAYESPVSAYPKSKGYYDCSEEIGGKALCLDDVDFLGHKFDAVLVFSNSKLITVSLNSAYDQSLYATVVGSLSKTFTLAGLANGQTELDLVQLASKASSPEEFNFKLTNYESAAFNSGNLVYTFIEGVDLNKRFASIASLLDASADNIRIAEVELAGEGADSSLIISFSFPNLDAKKVTAAAQKPVESF
ncbi:hypothetical protein [Pseudomonas fluorescens]|uniref:hypothetical protein n=1 Tax=Pseudomonas fluorescens TaxID=294 RepID=UPI000641A9C7|nr:hypothetical protein [Pseudomonas fluorescens]